MGAGRRFVRCAIPAATGFGLALAVAGCRDEPTAGTAPFAVEASLAAPPTAVVGTRLRPSPTFVVRNAAGQALANVPVSVTVTAGNGTLRAAPVRTGVGATAVGDWTLDTIVGVNRVTIVAGSAPPVTVEVVGVPDQPAAIRIRGVEPAGFAGTVLGGELAIEVVDRYGNTIDGVEVALSVAAGGGDVSPRTVKTGGVGARGVAWRLGHLGGTQRLVASAGGLSTSVDAAIRSDFTPIVRFQGTPPAAAVQEAFLQAADRIHAIITGDLSDVPVFNFDLARCGIQGGTLSEVIDDVVIYAVVAPMDGAGKVLASAGPCVTRTQSRLPVIGVMRFDSEDIPSLLASGGLAGVVLHEMLHVMGIGPAWRARNLIAGSGSADPRFTGTQAGFHCIAAGGAAACADQTVPLENVGGSGTVEVHWRESVFDSELMTGIVEIGSVMPLSSMSVASLEDIGFLVNLFAADPYTLPLPPAVAPRLAPSLAPPWESVDRPVFEVTPAGWMRPIAREP